MRYLFLLFALFAGANTFAQGHYPGDDSLKGIRAVSKSDYHHDTLKLFFDHNWKKTDPQAGSAMYFTEAFPLGINWCCLDFYLEQKTLACKGTYKDMDLKIKEGPFTAYYNNGQVHQHGAYIDNIKEGWWLDFNDKGFCVDSTFYIHGIPAGKSISKYDSGAVSDLMEMDKEGKGIGTEKEFFKSGTISKTGQFSKGYKKDGVWEYFYRDGKIAYRETYDKGKIISQTGFDHAGNVIKDCPAHSMPMYHRGMNKLNRYLANHIHFPPKYRATGEIIAEFIVDTSGKVSDIRIIKPLPSAYGDEAVKAYNLAVIKALEKMPDWSPGVDHNRKVKVYYSLPVNFKLD